MSLPPGIACTVTPEMARPCSSTTRPSTTAFGLRARAFAAGVGGGGDAQATSASRVAASAVCLIGFVILRPGLCHDRRRRMAEKTKEIQHYAVGIVWACDAKGCGEVA